MDTTFRAGRTYTLTELAELARHGLEEQNLSHARAVEILNEQYTPTRGKYHQPQISQALNNPSQNPGMVLLLVRAFTGYDVEEEPLYRLKREK